MQTLLWFSIGLLIVLSGMHGSFVWCYLRWLRSPFRPFYAVGIENVELAPFSGPVAVLLCVRGQDPALRECLEGLKRQTYTDFQLFVIADAVDDPALEVVRQNSLSLPSRIIVAERHLETSSLKCSSLVQALEAIRTESASFTAIALIDADVCPDSCWLFDLLQPLSHPQIGASTGNRWFAPAHSDWGSMFRQNWNGGAVPQMLLYGIPWGGSLAIRWDVVLACELEQHWSQGFCEDTMLPDLLKQQGLVTARVTNLVMANQETISWKSARRWITRQLITLRLHNRNWYWVLLHGMLTGWVLLLPVVVAGGLLRGPTWLSLGAGFAWIAYQVLNWVLARAIQKKNEQMVRQRNPEIRLEEVSLVSAFWSWRSWLALFATQWGYAVAAWCAWWATRVTWRGITYSISSNKVARLSYQPYAEIQGTMSSELERGDVSESLE